MLNLHYIIIGRLDKSQDTYLQSNLNADDPEGKEIEIIILEKMSRLQEIPAQESIFISGDYMELQQAIDYGMATLGYLRRNLSVREHIKNCVENSDMEDNDACPNTDMWAEGFEEVDLAFLTHVYERHHKIPWTILTTERCVIKEFSMEYLDDLFELYSGEGMTDYMEPLYPYEQEKEYQEAYIRHMYGFYGYGMWIVCDKETGKLIGRAGVEHREELNGEMELGYAIGVPYQRQGYATEVCKAILAYVKEELLQESVCCLIEQGNNRSEHFAEQLGFCFEQEILIGEKQMKKYTYIF